MTSINKFFRLISESSVFTKISMISCLVGIFSAAYIWYEFQGTQNLICPISNCAEILTSPTSIILGVHMSVYGTFFFILAAILLFQKLIIRNKVIDYMILGLASFGLAYTCMLRLVEIFIVHAWCIWCWITFAATIGLFFASLQEVKRIIKSER
jgi:uncharacterized membrane protein